MNRGQKNGTADMNYRKIDSRKRRRFAKDHDVLALYDCTLALDSLSPRMRKVTLRFLWNRFVLHPPATTCLGGQVL